MIDSVDEIGMTTQSRMSMNREDLEKKNVQKIVCLQYSNQQIIRILAKS